LWSIGGWADPTSTVAPRFRHDFLLGYGLNVDDDLIAILTSALLFLVQERVKSVAKLIAESDAGREWLPALDRAKRTERLILEKTDLVRSSMVN
nr:hypothetical protein [Micromonospora sp. DSM 115978]